MFLLPLLLACGGDDSLTDLSEDPTTDPLVQEESVKTELPPDDPPPSEYIFDDVEPGQSKVLLTTDELGEGLAEVFETMTWLDPSVILNTFHGLQADGDSECPVYRTTMEEDNTESWYEYCTADTGNSFFGNYYGYNFAPYLDGNNSFLQRVYFRGDTRMTDAAGNTLEASGSAFYQEYDNVANGYHYTYGYAHGEFRWDGPDASEVWIGSEISVGFTVSAYTNPANGSRYFYFDGSFSGVQGLVESAYMDRFTYYDELGGSDCGAEPAGMVSLRDAAGNWYDVEFQGSRYNGAAVFPLECDGCGKAYHQGSYLGLVCPDLTTFKNWEGRPWDRP